MTADPTEAWRAAVREAASAYAEVAYNCEDVSKQAREACLADAHQCQCMTTTDRIGQAILAELLRQGWRCVPAHGDQVMAIELCQSAVIDIHFDITNAEQALADALASAPPMPPKGEKG